MRKSQNYTAILFVTHRYDEAIAEAYKRLKTDCEGAYDVFFLFDASHTYGRLRPEMAENAVGFQPDRLILDMGLHLEKQTKIISGNWDLLPIKFITDHPWYRYIWTVEYDVAYTGNWRNLFSAFLKNDADLLGTTITRYSECPDWFWWESLKSPSGAVPKEKSLRGFFPIFRLSQQSAKALRIAYSDGWRGHYECTIPTILTQLGMRIEDIGGNGEFVNAGNQNRFYRSSPGKPNFTPGTFVWRPVCSKPGKEPGMLWHPVKSRTISVIISVYKTEQYLSRCLNSVLSQTYEPIEAIVVDDGSPGACEEIVRGFNGVQYIKHQENRGLFAARLTGVKAATGKYIAFVDADDYIHHDMYSVLLAKIEEVNADVAQCGAFLAFEDGRKTREWWFRVSDFYVSGEAVCQTQLARNRLFYIWNKLYHRDLFLKIPEKFYQLDNITMHEDILFSALLFIHVQKFVSIKDRFYHYVYNKDAETKAIDSKKVRDQMKSSAMVCELCEEIMDANEIQDDCRIDVQHLKQRLAGLYYANKIKKIIDPLERKKTLEDFTAHFGEQAVWAVENDRSERIIRKIYNHVFPPFSPKRYAIKKIIKPLLGRR